MGYNTTVIIRNDALSHIEGDKEFTNNLDQAIRERFCSKGQIDVMAGSHCNAATVIETHHADMMKLIAVGGNRAIDLGFHGFHNDSPEELMKSLAKSLGYRVQKLKEKVK